MTFLDFEQAFVKNNSSVHDNFKVLFWVFMNGANFKEEDEAKKGI